MASWFHSIMAGRVDGNRELTSYQPGSIQIVSGKDEKATGEASHPGQSLSEGYEGVMG